MGSPQLLVGLLDYIAFSDPVNCSHLTGWPNTTWALISHSIYSSIKLWLCCCCFRHLHVSQRCLICFCFQLLMLLTCVLDTWLAIVLPCISTLPYIGIDSSCSAHSARRCSLVSMLSGVRILSPSRLNFLSFLESSEIHHSPFFPLVLVGKSVQFAWPLDLMHFSSSP